MRDPELVFKAQQAAAALERAWRRWRVVHSLIADPMPAISSYVGYSLEEPWGQPRVVFGLPADDADQLAALLDRHDCVGPVHAVIAAEQRGHEPAPEAGGSVSRPLPVPPQAPSPVAGQSVPVARPGRLGRAPGFIPTFGSGEDWAEPLFRQVAAQHAAAARDAAAAPGGDEAHQPDEVAAASEVVDADAADSAHVAREVAAAGASGGAARAPERVPAPVGAGQVTDLAVADAEPSAAAAHAAAEGAAGEIVPGESAAFESAASRNAAAAEIALGESAGHGASDQGASDQGASDQGASDQGASDQGASDESAAESGVRSTPAEGAYDPSAAQRSHDSGAADGGAGDPDASETTSGTGSLEPDRSAPAQLAEVADGPGPLALAASAARFEAEARIRAALHQTRAVAPAASWDHDVAGTAEPGRSAADPGNAGHPRTEWVAAQAPARRPEVASGAQPWSAEEPGDAGANWVAPFDVASSRTGPEFDADDTVSMEAGPFSPGPDQASEEEGEPEAGTRADEPQDHGPSGYPRRGRMTRSYSVSRLSRSKRPGAVPGAQQPG